MASRIPSTVLMFSLAALPVLAQPAPGFTTGRVDFSPAPPPPATAPPAQGPGFTTSTPGFTSTTPGFTSGSPSFTTGPIRPLPPNTGSIPATLLGPGVYFGGVFIPTSAQDQAAAADRDAFQDSAAARLEDLRARLDALQDQAHGERDPQWAAVAAGAQDLEQQRQAAVQQLETLRSIPSEDYGPPHAQVVAALEELERSATALEDRAP